MFRVHMSQSSSKDVRTTRRAQSEPTKGSRTDGGRLEAASTKTSDMVQASKTAIVFGASGISGLAAVNELLSDPAYARVLAVCRHVPPVPPSKKLVHVPVDLLSPLSDAALTQLKSAGADRATLALYFAAAYHVFDPAEDARANTALFAGALAVVRAACPRLQRFVLQTGYKYWGCHVGPYGGKLAETPYGDDAERHKGENFYFAQEDMLREAGKEGGWDWTVVRPNAVVGWSKGGGLNIVMALGLYVAVKKRLGEPLDFLGNEISWEAIEDMSTASNTAAFCVWAATNPKAANEAFAIHDGDSQACKLGGLWTKMVEYFGFSLPSPLFRTSEAKSPAIQPGMFATDTSLMMYMADKRPVWAEICKEHGLREEVWDEMNWVYGGGFFGRAWESTATMRKAREIGWDRKVDSWSEWVKVWERMRADNELPPGLLRESALASAFKFAPVHNALEALRRLASRILQPGSS